MSLESKIKGSSRVSFTLFKTIWALSPSALTTSRQVLSLRMGTVLVLRPEGACLDDPSLPLPGKEIRVCDCTVPKATKRPSLLTPFCAHNEPNGRLYDNTPQDSFSSKNLCVVYTVDRLVVADQLCRITMGRMHAPGKGICTWT